PPPCYLLACSLYRRPSPAGGGGRGEGGRRAGLRPAHLTLPSLRDGPLVSLGCGLMGCGWGVKRITPNRDAAETAGPLSRKAREGARLPRRHLRNPEQLPGIASRTCKAGTRKMADIVITAGIDVSTDRLDL